MENSLTDYITVIEDRIHRDLISADHLLEIKRITDIFPSQITSMFGFECRLGDDRPQADLAFSILPEMAAILEGIDREERFWPRDGIWNGVREVISRIEEPGQRDVAGLLWLEFDLDRPVREVPAPGVFLSFERFMRHNRLKLSMKEKAERLLSASESVISSLRGRRFFDRIRPAFAEALRLLPEHSMLFQIGTMTSRPGEYVRICIQDMTSQDMITFLDGMKWPGSSEELHELADLLSGFCGSTVLALDLGESVLPKIGLEISFDEDDTAKGGPQWKEFLGYLTDEGLCTGKKADALLEYPGHILQNPGRSFWPANLRKASVFWGRSIFINRLDHFKVTYQKDCPHKAKAYLSVCQEWVKKAR